LPPELLQALSASAAATTEASRPPVNRRVIGVSVLQGVGVSGGGVSVRGRTGTPSGGFAATR
jgi:hypothetical protein